MVYIILGEGFEEMEAVIPFDMLRRAEIPVAFAAVSDTVVRGSRGISISADITVDEIDEDNLEMIILPGGLGGVSSIKSSPKTLALVQNAWRCEKFVAAICAAPTILAQLSITDGKRATCYPGMEDQMGSAHMISAKTVTDGKLITGQAAGAAFEFAKAIISALKDEPTAEAVAKGIVL